LIFSSAAELAIRRSSFYLERERGTTDVPINHPKPLKHKRKVKRKKKREEEESFIYTSTECSNVLVYE